MISPQPEDEPLISNRMLRRLTISIGLLAALMVAVSLGGQWIGRRIVLAGHTASEAKITVTIGPDRLAFPANVIRFPEARIDGPAERLDLYLTWPELKGYSTATADRFNDLTSPGQLIFLQVSQAVMSRDMSGRLDPIYKGLFEGAETPFEAGLTLHHLRRDSGYNGEVVLTAPRDGQPDYAVRCILPSDKRDASNADCQRDIFVGNDLSVLYRFSSNLLPQWQRMDNAIRAYVDAHLSDDRPHTAQP